MMPGRIAVLGRFASVVLALSVISEARAQSDAAPVTPSSPDSVADHQLIIRDRVERLEDRLFELSQVLRKMEPDRAQRLLETLGAARSLGVRRKMEDIVEEIRRDAFSDAVDGQEEVTANLHELLKVLLEEPARLEERKEEIAKLERVKEALKNLIEEQERELAAARDAIAEANLAKDLEAAADAVEALLERQRAAAQRDNSDAKEAASKQRAIREATDPLADKLERLSKGALGKAEPDDSDGGSAAGDCKAAGDAAKDLKAASDKMKSAEQKLESGRSAEAGKDQTKAEKDLESALEKLRDEAKKLRRKLRLEKQAEDQRKTAEKTAELGKQMKGESEGKESEEGDGQDGDPQGKNGGQSGENEGSQQPGGEQSEQPMPGQQDIEGAVPLQEDAADELDRQDADDAAKKQEEALQKLKQAQDELEDVLEQLRREQQEELLAALEARFRAMLAQQLECNNTTVRLADVGKDRWKRSDQLQLADLSQKQRWVGSEADKALAVLVEDGTTVVFPQILEQIRDDVFIVADRLAAADVGTHVRGRQVDIADTIRQLLDAVKRMQEENESGGGSGGGGGNSPLLPGSAELKLLRACQHRVNNATEGLDADRLRPTVTLEELAQRLEELQRRQEYVAGMAKDMHESMSRAQ